MTNDTTDLTALSTLAEKVAANHDELHAADAADKQAQAELLDRVVEKIRPALKALSSRIRVGKRIWWIGSTHTDSDTTESEYRGLVVSCEPKRVGPTRSHPGGDQNRGSLDGTDLFLTADGRWLEVTYSGSWSNWQGEGDEWEATERFVTTADVVREYNVEPAPDRVSVIGRISDALRAQAEGKAPERAKAARERAERIAAIAKLL